MIKQNERDNSGDVRKRLLLKEKIEKYKHTIFILIVVSGVLFVALLLTLLISNTSDEKDIERSFSICGDGTFNGTCSFDKPYYCNSGKLIKDSVICGCPEGFNKESGKCISEYEKFINNVSLDYVLMGEKGEINVITYKGVVDYLNNLEKGLTHDIKEQKTRADFKLKIINNEIQRIYLMPLVKKIQNLAPENKLNQARIAVSIVQNIPYGEKAGSVDVGNGIKIDASRYPYEVVFDNGGVCGEKVELLSFILREIGYGNALLYYPDENHEALGIKCPVEVSYDNTGYCFVETTAPSIISDSGVAYEPIGKLSDNYEIYLLSEGMSLPENIQEYEDADKIEKLREKGEDGKASIFDSNEADVFNRRYGLEN